MAPRVAEKKTCEYCGATYARKHGCRRSRAAAAAGDMSVTRAYELFCHWWAVAMGGRKRKTLEQFTKSPLFTTFVSLDQFATSLYLPSGKMYLSWLAENHVPSRDWTKNSTVDRYKREHSATQDPMILATRSLEKIAEWCDSEGVPMSEFFDRIGPGDALGWIRSGRLSPWILFNAEGSSRLFDRMEDHQVDELMSLIDVAYWDSRVKISSQESAAIKELLAGMELK